MNGYYDYRTKRAIQSALLGLTMLVGAGGQVMALEKPEYEVVFERDDVEYRRYDAYLVAETRITPGAAGSAGESASDRQLMDYNDAANEGFQRLFDYITGDNSARQEIAMTSPVQQSRTADQGEKIAMTAPVQQVQNDADWVVSFMLPSKYSLETAPVPADNRIRIRQISEMLVAVRRYSGRWTDANFTRHRDRLLDDLDSQGVEPMGSPVSAVYNPPFMPPFLRRNEILVPVERIPPAGS